MSREPRVPGDGVLAKSINFEITIADLARRSERRAWWVAFGASAMSLILAAGYFYILPLKESVPFLVMADAYTGTATVAQLRGDFSKNSITASEAINRSNVSHYVTARESYDLALLRLRDWKTVYTMSGPDVSAAYSALYAENNPSSPYHLYGKGKAIRVKILSIVLIGGGKGVAPKGATVRFQRSLYEKQSGGTKYLDSKLATMEFAYKPNLNMKEQDRIENPLGFQVTSYRVDNDYATPSPPQAELPPEGAGVEAGVGAEDSAQSTQAAQVGEPAISDQSSREK
ncbi:type IV secretion system protein [Luteimonas sp. SX5]|uniref:Type IV secretion system protein n=1 Tax=Luteimonas galliterrae TaxID=2940486 RepID=A0ABT0MKF1_9GAMM|nr:type IV secretion system protein [Luteimonas galliterrae]MCL1635123.1 type IV secretion system protein [Luteimonas galliterrae]